MKGFRFPVSVSGVFDCRQSEAAALVITSLEDEDLSILFRRWMIFEVNLWLFGSVLIDIRLFSFMCCVLVFPVLLSVSFFYDVLD